MGIRLGKGRTKRDWLKLTGSVTETALKAATLGKDGFAAAIPSLFRTMEALRGDDNVERRATRLVFETLSYAVAASIASVTLRRDPQSAEINNIVEVLLNRVEVLMDQKEVWLEKSHLSNPATFTIFADAADRIFHELKAFQPKEKQSEEDTNFCIRALAST